MRTHIAVRRAEASQRRTDTREWVMQRRERTRHLIELGGLVQKGGIPVMDTEVLMRLVNKLV